MLVRINGMSIHYGRCTVWQMQKSFKRNKQAVEVIAAKLRESSCTVVADYRGLNVAQVTELRKQLA